MLTASTEEPRGKADLDLWQDVATWTREGVPSGYVLVDQPYFDGNAQWVWNVVSSPSGKLSTFVAWGADWSDRLHFYLIEETTTIEDVNFNSVKVQARESVGKLAHVKETGGALPSGLAKLGAGGELTAATAEDIPHDSTKFDRIGGRIGPDDDDSASFSFGNTQGDALHVSESGGAMFATTVEIRGFGGATLSVESYDDYHPASIKKDGKEVATEEYVDNHVSPPSPTLRVYDEVRACWWIGRMVNGVMSWEVE